MGIKKQLKSSKFKNFHNSIPDGFLLTWEEPATPILYIVEFELESHTETHILQQIGNFIAFVQSSSADERELLKTILFNLIKDDGDTKTKISEQTGMEVHELLSNAMTNEMRILLVIDRFPHDLKIGLSKIEGAIRVPIRKLEIDRFTSRNNESVIVLGDSDRPLYSVESQDELLEKYELDYHTDRKPEEIVQLLNMIVTYIEKKYKEEIEIRPVQQYIGFRLKSKKRMILSCSVQTTRLVLYSLAKTTQMRPDKRTIESSDVSAVNHVPSNLPTQIIISDKSQIPEFMAYFERLFRRYNR